ncbi:hypothetical protein FRIGORI9N_70073 [Frigoribacterium sp. 9N]|nr:hypothetical protein FRIGORI9N_70073 [Frigoribacterium sp. 9N]
MTGPLRFAEPSSTWRRRQCRDRSRPQDWTLSRSHRRRLHPETRREQPADNVGPPSSRPTLSLLKASQQPACPPPSRTYSMSGPSYSSSARPSLASALVSRTRVTKRKTLATTRSQGRASVYSGGPRPDSLACGMPTCPSPTGHRR